MPVYRIELDVENEGELEVAIADGRWKPELVNIQEVTSVHVVTLEVTDPDSGGKVDIEIRKLETGAMVGLDGSWLESHDCPEHPLSPYDADCVVVVPDNETSGSVVSRTTDRLAGDSLLLSKVAGRLAGMHEDEPMSVAEKQIVALLLEAKLLTKDEEGNLID